MSRVRFDAAGPQGAAWLEARFEKPLHPPSGYTGNTVVTEWLTMNCRGDWASRAGPREIRVRFADPHDHGRAVAHFGTPQAPTGG